MINIELSNQYITRLGTEATIDFYQTIAIDYLECNMVFIFLTGVNSPFLNVVIDIRKNNENTLEVINIANDFFSKHNVPWSWLVVTEKNDNDLLRQGLVLLEKSPAMYVNLSNFSFKNNSDLLLMREVIKPDELHLWIQPINEAFQVKENDDSYRKLNADVLKKQPSKMRHYIAYYQNEIAAAGTLFLSNDAVMLHNLATKSAYTKRGIGTALTLHMMQNAQELGFNHCFLDSSAEGFNLYKKIGFRVYSTTHIYCATHFV